MSFEEPNDHRSSEIGNNKIQLTELATYEERTPGPTCNKMKVNYINNINIVSK